MIWIHIQTDVADAAGPVRPILLPAIPRTGERMVFPSGPELEVTSVRWNLTKARIDEREGSVSGHVVEVHLSGTKVL